MKYLLLIIKAMRRRRTTQTTARLSEDEQNAGTRTTRRSTRHRASARRPDAAAGDPTTVRVQDGRDTDDGRAVRRGQGGPRGYLFFEADDIDAAIELALAFQRPDGRSRRGASARGALTILEQVFATSRAVSSPA